MSSKILSIRFIDELKFFDISFAVPKPKWRIPREYNTFSRVCTLELLIAFIRLDMDKWPQPGNFISFSCFKVSVGEAKINISAGSLIKLVLNNSIICFSPKPSILKAFLDTKWINWPIICSLQFEWLKQRIIVSSSSYFKGVLHEGQFSGKIIFLYFIGRNLGL